MPSKLESPKFLGLGPSLHIAYDRPTFLYLVYNDSQQVQIPFPKSFKDIILYSVTATSLGQSRVNQLKTLILTICSNFNRIGPEILSHTCVWVATVTICWAGALIRADNARLII
jgi:hypothetical protein